MLKKRRLLEGEGVLEILKRLLYESIKLLILIDKGKNTNI